MFAKFGFKGQTKGLFVYMSPDDTVVQRADEKQAEHLGDEFVFLIPGCFDELKKSPVGDYRVTFSGHAGTDSFGEQELSPAAFLKKLVALGIPFRKINKIDLVGCAIGFGSDQTSFALEFARLLYQLPDTKQIEIRAINNFTSYDRLSHMQLLTKKGSLEFSMQGVPEEKKDQFERDYDLYQEEYKKTRTEIQSINANMLNCFTNIFINVYSDFTFSSIKSTISQDIIKKIREGFESILLQFEKIKGADSNFIKTIALDFESIIEMIQDIAKRAAETKLDKKDVELFKNTMSTYNKNIFNSLSVIDSKLKHDIRAKHVKQHQVEYQVWPDIRQGLDSSDKFLITYGNHERLIKFSYDEFLFWAMIQDRIKHKSHWKSEMARTLHRREDPRPILHRLEERVGEGGSDGLAKLVDEALEAKVMNARQNEILIQMSSRLKQKKEEAGTKTLGHEKEEKVAHRASPTR